MMMATIAMMVNISRKGHGNIISCANTMILLMLKNAMMTIFKIPMQKYEDFSDTLIGIYNCLQNYEGRRLTPANLFVHFAFEEQPLSLGITSAESAHV